MQKDQTKIVLVTGGARRIGAAITRHLHHLQCNVVIHYWQSVHEAKILCEELNKKRPDSAMMVQGDLTELSNLKRIIHEVINKWGALHALINNAATFARTELDDAANEKNWDEIIDINLKAPFFLSQAALPYLQKTQGCIVNIADIHGEVPMKSHAIYSISKSGLIMLTKALAKDWGAWGISVNAVAPSGGIIWPENTNSLDDIAKKDILQRSILKRTGTPEDIAKAVSYFVFDASFVTGQVLAVDGGRSLIM